MSPMHQLQQVSWFNTATVRHQTTILQIGEGGFKIPGDNPTRVAQSEPLMMSTKQVVVKLAEVKVFVLHGCWRWRTDVENGRVSLIHQLQQVGILPRPL